MARVWANVPINVCHRGLGIHNRVIGSTISVHTILALVSFNIGASKVEVLEVLILL
jgi:hypothetical protein